MGYSTRLPAAPLKRELHRAQRIHRVTWGELAERLRVSPRTLARLLTASDVCEPTADRMACRLGLHPTLIWPREWPLITNQIACSSDKSRRASSVPLASVGARRSRLRRYP